MKENYSTKRVIMAKRVAQEWLAKNATEEYRVRVYPSLDSKTNLPSWLRSFREGRSKMGSAKPFDFAVEEFPDHFCIRSRDYEGMKVLNAQLESYGYETTGIW